MGVIKLRLPRLPDDILTVTLLLFIWFIYGCTAAQSSSKAPVINDIQFVLPASVKWQQSKNQRLENGQVIGEWLVENHKRHNTPMLVAYQRFAQRQIPEALLKQLLSSYQQQCSDTKIVALSLATQYPIHQGIEIICSRFQSYDYGLVVEAVVFTDSQANHLLLGEAKTLVSEKAGQLIYNSQKEKQYAELSRQRFQALREMIRATRVCDIQKQCY